MGAVFVSYRRGDSEGQARALSLELTRLLGKDSVFIDVDSIALGRDFRQVVQERLNSCDLMLVLIGPGWLDAKDGSGSRRIENPTDFVRQEIAAALKRNIPVIPVLLQGAQLPQPERLPDDLKELAYRNGFELGHSTWESDVRELVRRLGLDAATPTEAPRVPSQSREPPTMVAAVTRGFSWRDSRVAGAVALLIVAAGLSAYFSTRNQTRAAENGASSQPLAQSALAPGGAAGITPLAMPTTTPGGALAGSGVEFVWPGDDCWDVYRDTEFVAYQCGSQKQALSAGRYIIKGKHAPVFTPFEVNIAQGTARRISSGGVFEFAWPGDDCWDIFRGGDYVTYQCGTQKQALGAGRYTIKAKHAPVFAPFTVDIKDASLTRTVMGAVFEFKWPGNDCWDIYRGADLVTYQCGSQKQALSAGRYTIKGKHGPVFDPFDVTLANGANVVKTP